MHVEAGCTLEDHFWNRQWSAQAGRTESWVQVLPVAKGGHMLWVSPGAQATQPHCLTELYNSPSAFMAM